MMAFFGIWLAMHAMKQLPTPVLWLDTRGNITVDGKTFTPRVADGATRYPTPDGIVYNFTGKRGGLHFGDLPELKLTGSITISVWLNPRSYVNDGPGAQILFRGDDRSGLDPYYMAIEDDGTINFAIENETGLGMKVKGELPLNRWTHVLANFNQATGELSLYENGERIAYAHTSKRPYRELDNGYTPGVGIGNVQNDHGPHNQPFNGMLADLRLYSGLLTPEDVGFRLGYRQTQASPTLLVRRGK